MRMRLLAAVLTVAACDSQPPQTIEELDRIVTLADAAIGTTQKIGTGAPTADIHEAMQKMNTALDAARPQIEEITRRVSIAKYYGRGSIDPRDVSVCVRVINSTAPSIEQMSMDVLAVWVSKFAECASEADTYLEAASGEDAAAVALAVSVIYPIKLVTEVKIGLDAEPALANYRSANEAIIAKLAPKCPERNRARAAETKQMSYECAAHDVAMSVQPKLAALEAQLSKSP